MHPAIVSGIVTVDAPDERRTAVGHFFLTAPEAFEKVNSTQFPFRL